MCCEVWCWSTGSHQQHQLAPLTSLTAAPAAQNDPCCCCCCASASAGKPLEYFYRHLYLPQAGMFRALPEDLGLGAFVEPPPAPVALGYADNGGFVKDGVEYK